MSFNVANYLAEAKQTLTDASPKRIISQALQQFGEDLAIAFSGAEDVLLLEYAKQTGQRFRVFSLDTGRLHPETYRFFEQVAGHYDIRIEFCCPDKQAVEQLVRRKGLFSFYQDGHQECCGIRKVEPLRQQLAGLRAWITGQRHDQSPSTRADVPIIEIDSAFKGKNGGDLIKFNPLAQMTSKEVWTAIQAFQVPYNPLHGRGFISIGCEPCTRPTLPGQHERDGRWWWERDGSKECGIHRSHP